MPSGFRVLCERCGAPSKAMLSTDFDIVTLEWQAAFTLFCPVCGQTHTTGETSRKMDRMLQKECARLVEVPLEVQEGPNPPIDIEAIMAKVNEEIGFYDTENKQ